MSAGAAGVHPPSLVGTQILDWQWPVARFRRGVSRLDSIVSRDAFCHLQRRAKARPAPRLADRLSTAFYFRTMAPTAPAARGCGGTRGNRASSRRRCRPRDAADFPDRAIWRRRLLLRPWVCLAFDMAPAIAQFAAAAGPDQFRYVPDSAEGGGAVRKRASFRSISKSSSNNSAFPRRTCSRTEKSGEKPNQTYVEAVADEPGGNQKGTPGKGPNPGSEGTEQSKSDEDSSGKPGRRKQGRRLGAALRIRRRDSKPNSAQRRLRRMQAIRSRSARQNEGRAGQSA